MSITTVPDISRQPGRDIIRGAISIAVITTTFLVLTPWWSGLDTPDSEFYASLAIFTDQVTDRAPVDSYFWTRLGYIVPVHSLIQIFGTWAGFAAYKALLLVIITSSIFCLVRRSTGFWRATWITAAASCSSVVLAYLGNPYITGSVMAGTVALAALATFSKIPAHIGSGLILGWLAMVYPGGALLGGTVWVALTIYRTRTTTDPHSMITLAGTAGATVVSFALFWLAGRALFPGLDWLSTYVEASQFDYSRYSSGEHVWLRDISLLVPLATLAISVVNAIYFRRRLTRDPKRRAAEWALIISLTSISFFFTYAFFFGEHFLEAPPSQAMMWPPAMLAAALVGASRMQIIESNRKVLSVVVALMSLAAIVVAGHLHPNIPLMVGWLISFVMVFVVVTSPHRFIATLLALTVFFAGAQLLQNSREPLGQFMLDPYAWGYQDNPNEEKIRVAVNAQRWLIDNTKRTDEILLWVDGSWVQGDRELYTVAAMQLWGDNRLTLEPTATDAYAIEALGSVRPSVVAMYGRSMAAIESLHASLPSVNAPSPPACYDFTWPIDPVSEFPTEVGHLCISRLSW